jgi:hypothetical protein
MAHHRVGGTHCGPDAPLKLMVWALAVLLLVMLIISLPLGGGVA